MTKNTQICSGTANTCYGEVMFSVYYHNTRNGFAHEAFITDRTTGRTCSHTEQYVNRTWEYWAGQSALVHCALYESEKLRDIAEKEFKRIHGYKRLTSARRSEFEEYLNECEEYNHFSLLSDVFLSTTSSLLHDNETVNFY